MTIALKGNTNPRQVFDSGDISASAGEIQRTIKWEGLYQDLEAQMPAVGDAWSENQDYEVLNAKLSKKRATLGVLTIVYVKQAGLETLETVSNLVIEFDWIREEIPLSQRTYIPGQDIVDIVGLIEDFLNERNKTERATIKADIIALGAAAEDLLIQRCAGVTSDTLYRPIVRKTSESLLRPSTLGTNLNKRQAPQIGTVSYPSTVRWDNEDVNWVYIKEVDRATRTGRNKKWQRVEEWQGYIEWKDTDMKRIFEAKHPAA